jgi:tRNA1Val (adenine37-N6)-methyltransferase
MDSSTLHSADETLDSMFRGALKVIQKRKGYRFSLDAVLLARLAPVAPGDRVIDLGTGCGIIPLILSLSGKAQEIVGVELQAELADLALRNVALNGRKDLITICREDVKNLSARFSAQSFDCVVSNPPFRKLATGRVNPEEQQRLARHEVALALQDLLTVSFKLLKSHGRLFLIYPAVRLVELLGAMRTCSLEPKALQTVHGRIDSPAKMVLVEGVRESGAELLVREPLVLYDSQGNHTEALQRIYALT